MPGPGNLVIRSSPRRWGEKAAHEELRYQLGRGVWPVLLAVCGVVDAAAAIAVYASRGHLNVWLTSLALMLAGAVSLVSCFEQMRLSRAWRTLYVCAKTRGDI